MIWKNVRLLAMVVLAVGLELPTCAKEKKKEETGGYKRGFIDEFPADRVNIELDRRNPFYYVGETIVFRLKGPQPDRFEVRDYYGEIVDKGQIVGLSITLKPQPPGWYKLYIFGQPITEPKREKRTKEEQDLAGDVTPAMRANEAKAVATWDYRKLYGDGVGGTMFVVARDNPNFPKLPPVGKYPPPGTGDQVMRGVTGMGPQRHSADASKPDESIKNLEAQIACDRELYMPFDPQRKRDLMIAFGGGTKGKLEGVRKIVEHFKNDVKYYEPRNEPNFGSSGADFVKNEMEDFYKTVKSVDPSLKVMGPGTVTVGPMPAGQGFIEDFLKAGGANFIDAFSFHAYNCCNGDLWMTRKTMTDLKTLLKKYNADGKELWQTEQGYFACVYGAYQPPHQAQWTMLEMMVYEQFGLPKEHNHLWYDRSHGFWSFPTWWENDDNGFNPALPLMRVFAEELFGTKYSKAYDLGRDGNKMYLGSLFEGQGKRVAAFISDGLTDGKIDLTVKGSADKLHIVSPFGVESDLPVSGGKATLPVGQLPVYVEFANGQDIDVVPQDFGTNLAASSTVTADGDAANPFDPKQANDISKLTNGQWENWYYTQKPGTGPWFGNVKQFPQAVEMKFAQATQIGRVIIYAPTPWQMQGSLVDYELQYDKGGKWETIEHVSEPLKTFKVLTPTTRTKVDSFFSDRHVFMHQFAPVTTGKIRLLIHNCTWGGGATEDVGWAGGQTGMHQVSLREIEVFAK